MNVRPAVLDDVPQLVVLSEQAKAESNLSGAELDVETCRLAWMRTIVSPSATVQVASRDGRLVGVMAAMGVPAYQCLDRVVVQDAMWYVESGVTARTAIRLLDEVERWASVTFDDKATVLVGVHDAIADPDLAARLLQRRGYEVSGHILRKQGVDA